jgi:hypothetical protein
MGEDGPSGGIGVGTEVRRRHHGVKIIEIEASDFK